MILRKLTTQKDYFQAMKIRTLTFIKEQNVDSEIEIDDIDEWCEHYGVFINEQMVATCRIFPADTIKSMHLGRIAVLKDYRNQHIGSFLMQEIEKVIKASGKNRIELGAQLQALPFYEKNGYHRYGECFVEADIMHTMMEKFL